MAVVKVHNGKLRAGYPRVQPGEGSCVSSVTPSRGFGVYRHVMSRGLVIAVCFALLSSFFQGCMSYMASCDCEPFTEETGKSLDKLNIVKWMGDASSCYGLDTVSNNVMAMANVSKSSASTLPVNVVISSSSVEDNNGAIANIWNFPAMLSLAILPVVSSDKVVYTIQAETVVGTHEKTVEICSRSWLSVLTPLAMIPVPGWADFRATDRFPYMWIIDHEKKKYHAKTVAASTVQLLSEVLNEDWPKYISDRAQYDMRITLELLSHALSADDRLSAAERLSAVKDMSVIEKYEEQLRQYEEQLKEDGLQAGASELKESLSGLLDKLRLKRKRELAESLLGERDWKRLRELCVNEKNEGFVSTYSPRAEQIRLAEVRRKAEDALAKGDWQRVLSLSRGERAQTIKELAVKAEQVRLAEVRRKAEDALAKGDWQRVLLLSRGEHDQAIKELAVKAEQVRLAEVRRKAEDALAKGDWQRVLSLSRGERDQVIKELVVKAERVRIKAKRAEIKKAFDLKDWKTVLGLCRGETDEAIRTLQRQAKENFLAERLRQERDALCDRTAKKALKKIRKSYANGNRFLSPFRMERHDSRDDWLRTWTEPRLDLTERDKLAGDALLSEFGTRYLPNAYANYEKARNAALERQQMFNETFPEPWVITPASPEWNAFNIVLEKFAKERAEYFLCHDELCHYWLANRLGALSVEDFAKMDSQRLAIRLLPESTNGNVDLIRTPSPPIEPMEGKYRDFAVRYAPESFAIYQKCEREYKELDKLLNEILEQCRQIDLVRSDALIPEAVAKRNGLIDEMNKLLRDFKVWQIEHHTDVKSSEDVAKSDHDRAMRLKPFLNAFHVYAKEQCLEDVHDDLEDVQPETPNNEIILGIINNMVSIPDRNYKIGKYEVTQEQWEAVMGENPSDFKGSNNPVENVSWDDCKKFLEKLNSMPEVKESGLTFRLPTEKEWEYACRAGATGDYYKLADGTEITKSTLGEVAWYEDNSGKKTHPVGQKKPNAFGLYDIHGNVWEWCEDLYRAGISFRVYRGGSWVSSSGDCTAGYRGYSDPDYRSYDLGFRLAAQTEEELLHAAKISEIINNMVAIPGKNFKMGKYEVTQAQWEAVMGENPSSFKDPDNPVERVSWDDCKKFLEKLNSMPEVKESGLTFRLPTEMEWEYACRAGSTGDYCKLVDGTEITESTLGEVAWYGDNSGSNTHSVGQKKPNAIGLYDMHGNVWEWCEDQYEAGNS